MSDDWKPGDLALCLSDGRGSTMKAGRIYVVRRFVPRLSFRECDAPALALDGVSHLYARDYWGADFVGAIHFRKITPDHKIEGFEEPRRLPVKEKADA